MDIIGIARSLTRSNENVGGIVIVEDMMVYKNDDEGRIQACGNSVAR